LQSAPFNHSGIPPAANFVLCAVYFLLSRHKQGVITLCCIYASKRQLRRNSTGNRPAESRPIQAWEPLPPVGQPAAASRPAATFQLPLRKGHTQPMLFQQSIQMIPAMKINDQLTTLASTYFECHPGAKMIGESFLYTLDIACVRRSFLSDRA